MLRCCRLIQGLKGLAGIKLDDIFIYRSSTEFLVPEAMSSIATRSKYQAFRIKVKLKK